jgi:hypothetical protein
MQPAVIKAQMAKIKIRLAILLHEKFFTEFLKTISRARIIRAAIKVGRLIKGNKKYRIGTNIQTMIERISVKTCKIKEIKYDLEMK